MPKPGPQPTPTALKVLRGNPGRRPLPVNEPKPADNCDDCPVWVCESGRVEWARLVPRLKAVGLFTNLDTNGFARYCECLGDWEETKQFLRENGHTYQTSTASGALAYKKFPQSSLLRDLDKTLAGYEASFGMSPASRTRLDVGESSEPKAGGIVEKLGLTLTP